MTDKPTVVFRWPIAKGSDEQLSIYPRKQNIGGSTIIEYYYRRPIPPAAEPFLAKAGLDPETFECQSCKNAGMFIKAIAPHHEYCTCPVGQYYRFSDGKGDPSYQGPAVPVRPGTALLMRYWKWTLDNFRSLPWKFLEGKVLAAEAVGFFHEHRGVAIKDICEYLQVAIPPLYDSFPNMAKSFRRSLIFYGNPGTGKTTLMALIAKDWQEKGYKFVVHEWRQMISEIQSTYRTTDKPKDRADIIREAATTPMLFLDDLGDVTRSGKPESDDRREIAREIISERYNRDLPFVITTNLPPDYMAKAFGPLVYERLAEMSAFVEVGGQPLPSRQK